MVFMELSVLNSEGSILTEAMAGGGEALTRNWDLEGNAVIPQTVRTMLC